MTRMLPKQPRLRLEPDSYKQLCRQVLARDNWRCQVCGSRNNLQVHHKQLRSQQGSDEESNLITLCANCHEDLHHGHAEDRTHIFDLRLKAVGKGR
jgi:5-methylcytosine-specific restriction endonuclease McrA